MSNTVSTEAPPRSVPRARTPEADALDATTLESTERATAFATAAATVLAKAERTS